MNLDYEAMVRWMFLQAEGINPTLPFNDGKPYGDAEWAIDREYAMKHYMHDARTVLDAAVPKPCEHGNYEPHLAPCRKHEACPIESTWLCDGKPEADNE